MKLVETVNIRILSQVKLFCLDCFTILFATAIRGNQNKSPITDIIKSSRSFLFLQLKSHEGHVACGSILLKGKEQEYVLT